MTSFIDDDGNELDYNGKDFAITKQIVSFFDFKIKGNVSVNLKVDNTAYNRKVLNYLSVQQIGSTIKKLFTVTNNGNKQMRGYITITNVDDKDIEFFFISGNSNWFTLWDFYCNEIVTTKYDVVYGYGFGATSQNIEDTWGRGYGITFPVIDWAFGGQRFGWSDLGVLDCYTGDGGTSPTPQTDPNYNFVQEIFPCLYIHTLLKLLANHSGTNIGGNLFEDRFFNTVIITPDGPDFWSNRIQTGSTPKTVKPEHIAPKIKAIDMIKWAAISFGCNLTFNSESNTIELNMVDKLKKSDAEDWSDYFISGEYEISKYFDKNYIKYKVSKEQNIADYDLINDVDYAGLLIDSDKDDGSVNNIYTAPFMPSYDKVGTTDLKWATPATGFYEFTDEEGFAFSSVSNSGGQARFNGTGFPWGTEVALIVRVVSSSGLYDGYHRCTGGNSTTLDSGGTFSYRGNDTGTIYVQSHNNVSGHRILSCINTSVNTFTQYTSLVLGAGVISAVSTVDAAYFSKGLTIYSALNTYNQGLSYGAINEGGRNDITLQEKYLNTYTNILKSPPFKCKMLLPEAVFAKYNFGIVFLNTVKFTANFLVELIQQYENAQTPVTVYLRKID